MKDKNLKSEKYSPKTVNSITASFSPKLFFTLIVYLPQSPRTVVKMVKTDFSVFFVSMVIFSDGLINWPLFDQKTSGAGSPPILTSNLAGLPALTIK
uniref:Uncharacterized protein n=1 Tax=Romanomermis culicivorax TaxID=13658 RepID=A0A915IWY8_ROMCU